MNRLAQTIPVLVMLGGGLALAEPPVIYDSGTSRSITEFVKMATPQETPQLPPPPSGEALAAQFLAALFPIQTPELTPGSVAPTPVNLNLPQPFFLIGSDALSKQWLGRYRDKLAQANALGLVVNVATVEEYQALQALAGDAVQLTPAPGSDIVQALQGVKLSHYPVLISSRRIEQ